MLRRGLAAALRAAAVPAAAGLVAAASSLVGCGPGQAAKTAEAEATDVPSTSATSCVDRANAQRAKRPDEPGSVHVQHVLVKHKDAKIPRDGVTRSREEACARAEDALAKMKQGASFDAVVAEFSDEAGASTRSGDIGVVTRSEVQPAFADAAFNLDHNQLSDVVETDFGFHLILRVP